MPPPTRNVALAFFAHPDDAEILCAGTLLRLRDLGWEIHIATATPGDAGTMTLSAEEIAAIRRGEGASSARLVDGTYHCLEERDAKVVYNEQSNQKAIDLFRQVNPTLVFTHPREDYMLDHEQVHLLARSASFAFGVPNVSEVPRPDGATIPWLYYTDPVEGRNPYTGAESPFTTMVDISSVMDRKVEMLACHASQREWLRAHHGMDEYIDAMRRHGSQRGEQACVPYAEAFQQHMGHPFPQNDLLTELLGGQS
ncbi:PIG-L deacetylase family protein [Aeoliella sp.]|uniref:PIG-L deacetylase family protein n=1 Tax=Aeoliella sp. TaxID=2795800 RepID=UPI003CCB842A